MYQGSYLNNYLEGFGCFYFPDGKLYQGFYKKDKKSGFGLFKLPNNKEYMGEWKDGKREGEGWFFNGTKWKKSRWVNNERT